MGWKEEYEAEQAKICKEMDEIIAKAKSAGHEALIALDRRFLKNFGCINFKSDAFYHELDLAREYHRRCILEFPEKHQQYEAEPYRCYHVTGCSCGFREECDSSD